MTGNENIKMTKLGNWKLDPCENQLIHVQDQTRIHIEPRSMRVLLALLETPGQVVSKNDLIDRYWAGIASDEVLTATIARLRKKLGDTAAKSAYIETVPKIGYRINPDILKAIIEPSVPDSPKQKIANFYIPLFAVILIFIFALFRMGFKNTTSLTQPFPIDRAELLIQRGDATAAESLLLASVSGDNPKRAWLGLADLYAGKQISQLGLNANEAHEKLLHALSNAKVHGATEDETSIRSAFAAFYLAHDRSGAEAFLRDVKIETEPVNFLSATLLIANGDYKRADARITKSLNKYPGSDRLIGLLKWNAYLSRNQHLMQERLKLADSLGDKSYWINGLIAIELGDWSKARKSFISFYKGRTGFDQAQARYETENVKDFSNFIESLNASGSANCMDRSFALAVSGSQETLQIELDECKTTGHPVAVWIPQMPIFKSVSSTRDG